MQDERLIQHPRPLLAAPASSWHVGAVWGLLPSPLPQGAHNLGNTHRPVHLRRPVSNAVWISAPGKGSFPFLMILWRHSTRGEGMFPAHVLPQLFQFSSVAQCPTLCDPMNHSTPGLPVHHQLPEFTQTHVHGVSDASSHLILCRPPLLLPPIPPSIRVSPH